MRDSVNGCGESRYRLDEESQWDLVERIHRWTVDVSSANWACFGGTKDHQDGWRRQEVKSSWLDGTVEKDRIDHAGSRFLGCGDW